MRKIICFFVVLLIQMVAVFPVVSIFLTLDESNRFLYSELSIGESEDNKWAVFITAGGGPSYEHHEKRDRNDVNKLKSILLNNGWNEDHILTILEDEATEEAILNQPFEWLDDAGEDDLIFFYFSLHGTNHTHDVYPLDEPDGKDEIIFPWDEERGGWNIDKFIVDDVLAEKFDLLHSKNILIVFHTCHSGGMIDGTCDFAKSGRVVLTSCGVNEGSIMLLLIKHWLFPFYLIQGMNGDADGDNDNVLSAEELFFYTEEPVAFHSTLLNFLVSLRILTQHPQMYDGWPTDKDNSEELQLISYGAFTPNS